MNLTQFQTLSKRTMPFGGEPANQVEFENMLGNYAMGLVGEITEVFSIMVSENPHALDDERLLKELGDVCHYAVGISCLTGNELPATLESVYANILGASRCLEGLVEESGLILEDAKKVIYHRHEFKKENFSTNEIFLMIAAIAEDNGYEMSEIYQANINKLKTRYPDKFSVEDSIARVDTK